MKIEIDTKPKDAQSEPHTRRMRMTIDGREFVISREGCVVTLTPPAGPDSLGAIVASELFSLIDSLRQAEETLHDANVFDPWETISESLAGELEDCL
mgnify:CR=1 FL=1